MTTEARISTWSRRFVVAGVGWLVVWQLLATVDSGTVVAGSSTVRFDLPRRAAVPLGLGGFVFHVVFGKAYSLIPSYFERQLATHRLLPVHFSLTTLGVAGLGVGPVVGSRVASGLGALAWFGGVTVFVGTLVYSIRDNVDGAETGTGTAKSHLRATDRVANAFVPVVFGYLLLGSYALLASSLAGLSSAVLPGFGGVPFLLDGYPPRSTHLLAAGSAALLIFSVGSRLLPRFFVATPPVWLTRVTLALGAVAPGLLAWGLPSGTALRVGAALEAGAVVGYATLVVTLRRRSDRDRVGFDGVLAGALSGVIGVLLGLSFAFGRVDAALATVHFRVNVLGFLGTTIVGLLFQFYPPAVGTRVGVSDRTARVALGAIAVGLLFEVVAGLAGESLLVLTGRGLELVGVVSAGYLVVDVAAE